MPAGNHGRVYHTSLDLSRLSILDLRPARLDAAKAAAILTALDPELTGTRTREPHCVLGRTSDDDLRAPAMMRWQCHECTDGIETDSLCLIGR